jgi:hypothetical protein
MREEEGDTICGTQPQVELLGANQGDLPCRGGLIRKPNLLFSCEEEAIRGNGHLWGNKRFSKK